MSESHRAEDRIRRYCDQQHFSWSMRHLFLTYEIGRSESSYWPSWFEIESGSFFVLFIFVGLVLTNWCFEITKKKTFLILLSKHKKKDEKIQTKVLSVRFWNGTSNGPSTAKDPTLIDVNLVHGKITYPIKVAECLNNNKLQ